MDIVSHLAFCRTTDIIGEPEPPYAELEWADKLAELYCGTHYDIFGHDELKSIAEKKYFINTPHNVPFWKTKNGNVLEQLEISNLREIAEKYGINEDFKNVLLRWLDFCVYIINTSGETDSDKYVLLWWVD